MSHSRGVAVFDALYPAPGQLMGERRDFLRSQETDVVPALAPFPALIAELGKRCIQAASNRYDESDLHTLGRKFRIGE